MPEKGHNREERVHRGAIPLSDALQDFLQRSGLTTLLSHPAMWEAWQSCVGPELSSHARVSSFRSGALEIEVDSSALRNEMQFCREALLEELRLKVKRPFISRLSFIVGPANDSEE